MNTENENGEINRSKDKLIVEQPTSNTRGFLALPFDRNEFADFLVSLLGKPQVLQRRIRGSFSIELADIRNFHYLLLQRINQQNVGELVSFTARIGFDDDSSVEINGFDVFESYNIVKPLITTSISLHWIFLVQFSDKTIPEKQTVVIKIEPNEPQKKSDDDDLIDTFYDMFFPELFGSNNSMIRIEVHHTARTWADDIDAMLNNHVNALLLVPNKFKEFFYKTRWIIALALGILFFIMVDTGYSINYNKKVEAARSTIESSIINQPDLGEKLNEIFSFMLQSDSLKLGTPDKVQGAIIFLSIGFTLIVGITVQSPNKSFLILSKKSMEHKKNVIEKANKGWVAFIVAAVVNIVLGLASNYIFSLLIK